MWFERGEGMASAFTYHPIPPELRELAAELESLGGGDARVGQLEVVARIRPISEGGTIGGGKQRQQRWPRKRQGRQQREDACEDEDGGRAQNEDLMGMRAVWAETDVVTLRNPTAGELLRPQATAADLEAMHNYRVSVALPAEATNAALCESLVGATLDWLWDGFNGTLLAFGQSGSGKTHSLLGSASCMSEPPERIIEYDSRTSPRPQWNQNPSPRCDDPSIGQEPQAVQR